MIIPIVNIQEADDPDKQIQKYKRRLAYIRTRPTAAYTGLKRGAVLGGVGGLMGFFGPKGSKAITRGLMGATFGAGALGGLSALLQPYLKTKYARGLEKYKIESKIREKLGKKKK